MLIFHIRTCFSNYKLFSKSFNLSFTKNSDASRQLLSCFLVFFPFLQMRKWKQPFNDKSKAIHSMCDQTKTRIQVF